MPPDLLELVMECVVVGNQAQLAFVERVFLQRPIRWRSDNQMDGFGGYPIQMSSIPLVYDVLSYRALLKGRLSCHAVFILAQHFVRSITYCDPLTRRCAPLSPPRGRGS